MFLKRAIDWLQLSSEPASTALWTLTEGHSDETSCWVFGWFLHPSHELQGRHDLQQKPRGAAGETATGTQNTRTRSQRHLCARETNAATVPDTNNPIPMSPITFPPSPRFSSVQLDRKTLFFFPATKWLGVAPPPQRRTCTTHLPVFVPMHTMQTLPFSHPGIRLRIPVQRCDQDFFGMCRGIAARSGRGGAGVAAELPGWKRSGSALAELSTGSIYLLHVCGLRGDVMRNLFTCASLVQKKKKKCPSFGATMWNMSK